VGWGAAWALWAMQLGMGVPPTLVELVGTCSLTAVLRGLLQGMTFSPGRWSRMMLAGSLIPVHVDTVVNDCAGFTRIHKWFLLFPKNGPCYRSVNS
jgi:hypothetical protein